MDGEERISFLGTRCPRGFRLRTRVLEPGEELPFRAADWQDALVLVEIGELEVECWSGASAGFQRGAALEFAGLTPRCLRNPGDGPLVLAALSRA
ncbi:quercetin dioxygenase-like cupin family protein [Kitasatospora sp. MAA4]|uniref:hypothetical protein n=1 Tax=Kitasatospora sp. MAA4 TaxID=3035093 RepID=UPI002473408C|nr:hypothetical protein [Kitasatospora sp. MAA4]MDH6137774.1 quercetin dioxygenase-like cupin family protein [Kitasatospora sp. MAA4]